MCVCGVCVCVCVCVLVCLCVHRKVDKIVLNGGEYGIGWDCYWDYDVYLLNYSKPLVI